MMQQAIRPGAGEFEAALLQTAVTLGIAGLCAFLYRRYRKPYLGWFALAWLLYLVRLAAIDSFLATGNRIWLYWHQVATGWTALALLWAALMFSRGPRWRMGYLALALFPPVWSYVAIFRLDSFLLAALPAVLFLSVVTLGTGWVFAQFYRQVRSSGALLLAVALLVWGAHHLDYPFLRARGVWTPWGYYLDIMFTGATAAGILLLVLDDLRRGLEALLTVSGDLAVRVRSGGSARLLERLLALPAVRGSALYTVQDGRVVLERGVGVCAAWTGEAEPAGGEEIERVVSEGRPRLVSRWRGFAFAAIMPVFHDGIATHALVLVGNARDPFAALDTDYLLALGQQIGAAQRSDELYARLEARRAELERLSRRMLEQHELERRRLSLHLHDETAQLFTAAKLQLGVVQEQLHDPDLRRKLGDTLDLLDEGISSIRNVTNDLRPSLLDDLGLLPALRSLSADWSVRGGIAVDVETPAGPLPAIDPDAELALFRALQESLSNVVQHAHASLARVRIAETGGTVVLEVSDDGRGFPPSGVVDGLERAGHLGLAGMRERITALGGTVELLKAEGGGARVLVRVPAGRP